MYSGFNQAKQFTGSKAGKNSALRVAYIQNSHSRAGGQNTDTIQKQTVLSSTSGCYYMDGIAVSATDTEESVLYTDQYELSDSYY